MKTFQNLFIDGSWRAAESSEVIEVINPATEAVFATIPSGACGDVDRVVLAAREAFSAWSETSVEERVDYIGKIFEGLKARAAEIGETITEEMGMPLKLSNMIQAGSPIGQFKTMTKILSDFSFEDEVGNSKIFKEAIGVAACITPWNYPLHQIAAKVAPALAAGCTVVLKPSQVAPVNAFILAEVIEAAGLPKGVFNLVTGRGSVIGNHLVAHPEVDVVSFTGSTGAGVQISEQAAQTIKRVTLELGGKSAAIVLDDADLSKTVKGVVSACFLNSGQTCTAHTRMLVPAAKYDEVKSMVAEFISGWRVGDPKDPAIKLGPLASEAQFNTVQEYIAVGQQEGLELVCGGLGKPDGLTTGYYAKPTVFGKVPATSRLFQEEIFGPVLSISTYESEQEAIDLANDSIFGLSGGVWSADQERAISVAKKIRTGMVDINGGAFNPLAPFGGYKQSGNGREFGEYGLEEFLELKAVQL